MGATITCAKRAAAFADPSGAITYVLFESTFEQNVRPHRPHWCCRYVGDLPGALRRVFADASACESGLLAARGCRRILPEAYINSWLRELSRPLRQRDVAVSLWAGEQYYAPIPKALAGDAAAILEGHGLAEVADAIRDGRAGEAWKSVELRMHRHTAAIQGLLGGLQLPPWRLLGEAALDEAAERDARLGYHPEPGAGPVQRSRKVVTAPKAYDVDGNHRLLRREDGSWRCAGWSYAIVGQHVSAAWEAELEQPGRYRRSIPALRAALEAAPPIPPGTRVAVATNGPMDRYLRQRCEQVTRRCRTTPTPDGFEAAPEPEALYDLCSLGGEIATWILPEPGPAEEPAPPTGGRQGQLVLA